MKNFLFIFFSLVFINNCSHAGGDIISESSRETSSGITYRTRLIHDPEKIEAFTKQFPFSSVASLIDVEPNHNSKSMLWNPMYDVLSMGEKRISQNGEKILYTNSLRNCVGVTIWDPERKIAGLYHVSNMQLGEHSFTFEDGFLKPILEKITDPSRTTVNIVSSYWSENVTEVIQLLQGKGFPISGVSIPDGVIENKDLETNIYVNKDTVSKDYLNEGEEKPESVLCIDSQTGQVGFKHYNTRVFFY